MMALDYTNMCDSTFSALFHGHAEQQQKMIVGCQLDRQTPNYIM